MSSRYDNSQVLKEAAHKHQSSHLGVKLCIFNLFGKYNIYPNTRQPYNKITPFTIFNFQENTYTECDYKATPNFSEDELGKISHLLCGQIVFQFPGLG
jgi:hypothetical protein